MSLKCDRCSEVIKSPDSGDEYSEVWAFFKDEKMSRATKITIKIENMNEPWWGHNHRDDYDNDDPIGNLCLDCLLELAEDGLKKIKETFSDKIIW
jgi:hypothetical protein